MSAFQQRMAELRLRFLDRAARDHERIEGALDQGDFDGLHQIAHRLHGIAGSFGFTAVSASAAALEAAIEEEPDAVLHRSAELLHELAAIAPEPERAV